MLLLILLLSATPIEDTPRDVCEGTEYLEVDGMCCTPEEVSRGECEEEREG